MPRMVSKLSVTIDQLEQCDDRYRRYFPLVENTEVETELAVKDTKIKTRGVDRKPSGETGEIPSAKKSSNTVGDEANRVYRKSMIGSKGYEPVDFAYERSIGENDSVYSNFIELILQAKKKVARIVIRDGLSIEGYATGFMVSDQLLMTNWHVFKTKESIGESTIEFNYELDLKANPRQTTIFQIDPDTFYQSSEELDYCLVAVKEKDMSGQIDLASFGYIPLEMGTGKLGDIGKEALNIIHHPDGDYMQLSIRENTFSKVLPYFIWYKSDTAQGSSGSPVFNDQWQLVALHHMGVAKKSLEGDYIDANNEIIPIVDGKVDLSRIVWIANEGVRISVILEDLKNNYSNLEPIQKILREASKTKIVADVLKEGLPPNDIEPGSKSSSRENNIHKDMKDQITITLPQSLLVNEKQVNINLTTNSVFNNHKVSDGDSSPVTNRPPADLRALETLRRERSVDYSDCQGYDPGFLGVGDGIPFPLPNDSIVGEMIRSIEDDKLELDYYKFSVIFNASRMMPAISGININGGSDLRKDTTKRKDDWIRDRRIDLSVQLNYNDFYKKSGFDRGHMTRREDANWGATAAEAKRNADLTCVYTNACPQVPSLNRSNLRGLWGKLEKVILEYGAEKEDGGVNKISVFSGPIFKDNDRTFRGVQIPMDFYKIILWLTDQQELKATAFKLSQVNLVDDIDFEQIDLDRDTEFQEYMCSISNLTRITNIDFSHLDEFDTHTDQDDTVLDCEDVLLEMLKSNEA